MMANSKKRQLHRRTLHKHTENQNGVASGDCCGHLQGRCNLCLCGLPVLSLQAKRHISLSKIPSFPSWMCFYVADWIHTCVFFWIDDTHNEAASLWSEVTLPLFRIISIMCRRWDSARGSPSTYCTCRMRRQLDICFWCKCIAFSEFLNVM